MLSLKAFLSETLSAAAEEIFGAVEKMIAEYKEEISRSKDLEITRLTMQLKLLKSEPRFDRCFGGQLHSHHHPNHSSPSPSPLPPPEPPLPQQQHDHPSAAAPPEAQQHSEGDGDSDMEPEHPELSLVKKEQQHHHHHHHHHQHKSHSRDFWMNHDTEHLDGLDPDIKDLISSPSGLHNPSSLPFHHNHGGGSINGDEGKDKPYCCSVCEKRFTNCSHLAAHIRTHTGERPYRCDVCRKTFVTTSALNRHQTIHTEGKHFICNYCGKSFKWMESLGRHIRSVHKRENPPLT